MNRSSPRVNTHRPVSLTFDLFQFLSQLGRHISCIDNSAMNTWKSILQPKTNTNKLDSDMY